VRRATFWPERGEVAFALVLAALAVAADVALSRRVGLLASPPTYDGVSYAFTAKRCLTLLHGHGGVPGALYQLFDEGHLATLWDAAIALSNAAFGDGDAAAATARFWPAFLLVLLATSLARSRGGRLVGLAAGLGTASSPIVSVCLSSLVREKATGQVFLTSDWYLADLRPDFLAGVLLVWAIVLVLENARSLDRGTAAAAGACAGLSVLAKSSTMPLQVWGVGLALAIYAARNRDRLAPALRPLAWGLAAGFVVVAPWVLAGGPLQSIQRTLYAMQGGAYSRGANPTLYATVSYYPRVFGWSFGDAGASLLVGLAVLGAAWRRDAGLLGLLLVTLGIYAFITAPVSKTPFVGEPFYAALWAFACGGVATLVPRRRWAGGVLLAAVCLHSVVVLAFAAAAYRSWPFPVEVTPGLENRAVTRAIVQDLRGVLRGDDEFVSVYAYGYPDALRYELVDADGLSPRPIAWDDLRKDPVPAEVARFLDERVGACKAILVCREPPEHVQALFPSLSERQFAFFRELAVWVARPGSGFVLASTYRFSDRTPVEAHALGDASGARGLTIDLWVRRGAR
jgi:hypothetical protein